MEDSKFYDFLLAAYKNVIAVLDDGAGAYIFHADTECLNFRKAFKDAGFHLANVCIWVKQSLVFGMSDYQWQHKPVLYCWKPTGKHRWYVDRKQTTVWNFDRPTKSPYHPTMKPVPLVAYPIKLKHTSYKEKKTDNEKFTMRAWLLRLGFIGDRYKAARNQLLRNLSGNSAFKTNK